MGGADALDPAVAGEGGEDSDAEFLQQRGVLPHVAGDVVFSDEIDVEVGGELGLPGSDEARQDRFPPEAAAEVLAADEARSVDGDHGKAVLFRSLPAKGLDIVADKGGDAGGIDEDRLRGVVGNDVVDGGRKLFLSPEDHVVHGGGGGESHLGEVAPLPAGLGGAGLPGGAQAGDGAVNEVRGVGIGEKGDLRSLESAAARGRPRLRSIAGRLSGLVVGAGGFVQQLFDFRFSGHCPLLLPGGFSRSKLIGY